MKKLSKRSIRERIIAGAAWNPDFGEKPVPPRLSVLARFIKRMWPELTVTLKPWTTSTDRKLSGSRLCWPGKGRKGQMLEVRDPTKARSSLAEPHLLLRHESGETYRHNGEVCQWIMKRLET